MQPEAGLRSLELALGPFAYRYGHTCTEFNSGVVLIGGKNLDPDGGSNTNNIPADLWFTTDGKTWEELESNLPFLNKFFHQTISFNDKLFVIGGSPSQSDVWVLK